MSSPASCRRCSSEFVCAQLVQNPFQKSVGGHEPMLCRSAPRLSVSPLKAAHPSFHALTSQSPTLRLGPFSLAVSAWRTAMGCGGRDPSGCGSSSPRGSFPASGRRDTGKPTCFLRRSSSARYIFRRESSDVCNGGSGAGSPSPAPFASFDGSDLRPQGLSHCFHGRQDWGAGSSWELPDPWARLRTASAPESSLHFRTIHRASRILPTCALSRECNALSRSSSPSMHRTRMASASSSSTSRSPRSSRSWQATATTLRSCSSRCARRLVTASCESDLSEFR
mmetsp:Transcript_22378/g.53479  ORF Transcript_22378/g.53479 Transcript_22378/m.53479 type:complete len:281 (-) Transcript_22378:640-1482(-)